MHVINYDARTTVARPAEEVFAAVVDIARWGEWTDMTDIAADGDGPVAVGASGRFSLSKGPFRGPLRYQVTDLEPGRRVRYQIEHPAFDWNAEMAVEPLDQGTRLGTSGTMRLHGVWRLLQPLVAGEVRRGEAGELMRLKAILEGNDGDDPAVRRAEDHRT